MPPCGCPICTFTRAHKEAGHAVDALVERSADLEGSYYYLLDEVEAAIKAPAPLRKWRLMRALRTVRA